MAVAIVQSKTASAAAGANPTARLTGVTANNTLLAFCLESGGTIPGIPTDTGGDVFTVIEQIAQGNLNVSLSLAYSLRSVGGNQTISVPTTASSNLVAVELSGVVTPTTSLNARGLTIYTPAPIPDGFSDGQAFGTVAGGFVGTSNPKGDLVFALCAAAGTPTITFNGTGWTAAGSGQAQGVTYDVRTISVAGPTSLSPSWSLSVPSSFLTLVVAFPAA